MENKIIISVLLISILIVALIRCKSLSKDTTTRPRLEFKGGSECVVKDNVVVNKRGEGIIIKGSDKVTISCLDIDTDNNRPAERDE